MIARGEQLVTRQRMVVAAMACAGVASARAEALLAVMEGNLAAVAAWRERVSAELDPG